MNSTHKFLRTASRIINAQNNFIDFHYTKHHTAVEQKKYMQLLLLEKQVELANNQLFLLREGLGRTMFNKVKHQLNIINVKISQLKKKYR